MPTIKNMNHLQNLLTFHLMLSSPASLYFTLNVYHHAGKGKIFLDVRNINWKRAVSGDGMLLKIERHGRKRQSINTVYHGCAIKMLSMLSMTIRWHECGATNVLINSICHAQVS